MEFKVCTSNEPFVVQVPSKISSLWVKRRFRHVSEQTWGSVTTSLRSIPNPTRWWLLVDDIQFARLNCASVINMYITCRKTSGTGRLCRTGLSSPEQHFIRLRAVYRGGLLTVWLRPRREDAKSRNRSNRVRMAFSEVRRCRGGDNELDLPVCLPTITTISKRRESQYRPRNGGSGKYMRREFLRFNMAYLRLPNW